MRHDVAALVSIHAEAFDASWDEASLASLLASPGVFAVAQDDGFILIRVVADEAEILTVAVRPSARRRGLARQLLEQGLVQALASGAATVFLEVAQSNDAARGLYSHFGFEQTGLRRGYYAKSDGSTEDALVLSRKFPEYLP